MSLSLRALATSTSCPHCLSNLLTQDEWVPVSMAMRMDSSEAKRRSKAWGLVRNLPSSTTSPLCWSMRHRWEYLSPRSNPAIISGRCLLPSMWADPPFQSGPSRARRTLADLRVLRMGGRPSHLIFLEPRKMEVHDSHICSWRIGAEQCAPRPPALGIMERNGKDEGRETKRE